MTTTDLIPAANILHLCQHARRRLVELMASQPAGTIGNRIAGLIAHHEAMAQAYRDEAPFLALADELGVTADEVLPDTIDDAATAEGIQAAAAEYIARADDTPSGRRFVALLTGTTIPTMEA